MFPHSRAPKTGVPRCRGRCRDRARAAFLVCEPALPVQRRVASAHGCLCPRYPRQQCRRVPAWQLDRDGRPYAALQKLHEILASAWAVYRFLVSPQGALGGRNGLDALKRGRDNDVIAAAEGIARGDFR